MWNPSTDLRPVRIEGLEGCPLLWNLNLSSNFIERQHPSIDLVSLWLPPGLGPVA